MIWGLFFVLSSVAPRLLPGGSDPVSLALLLAILSLVPLGLSLVRANEAEGPFFLVLAYLLPAAQIGGVAAITLGTGPFAGAAASLWVVAAIVIAVMGLGRLRSSTAPRRAYDLGVASAWIFLPVGAVWLVMARVGASPLGLSSLLVSLTAVHFHYAAFATPLLFALVWDRSSSVGARRALLLSIGLAAVAIVLVAVGITLSPTTVDRSAAGISDDEGPGRILSQLGALLFTLAFVLHATVLLTHVGPRLRPLPRVLTSLGALAPLAALPLALLFTVGAMDLDTMVHWHGQLNAYAFAGLSLLGWAFAIHGDGKTS